MQILEQHYISKTHHKWLAIPFSENDKIHLRSDKGSFGSGFYFGDIDAISIDSESLVDNVITIKANIKKPFVFEAIDKNNASSELLKTLFPEESLIELSLKNEEIENHLKALDYDGLLVVLNDYSYDLVIYSEDDFQVI